MRHSFLILPFSASPNQIFAFFGLGCVSYVQRRFWRWGWNFFSRLGATAVGASGVGGQKLASQKLTSSPKQDGYERLDFKYHNYERLTNFLRTTSRVYPNLTALYSIGRSVQGMKNSKDTAPATSLPRTHMFCVRQQDETCGWWWYLRHLTSTW